MLCKVILEWSQAYKKTPVRASTKAFQQAEMQLFVMVNLSPLPIQFKVGMR